MNAATLRNPTASAWLHRLLRMAGALGLRAVAGAQVSGRWLLPAVVPTAGAIPQLAGPALWADAAVLPALAASLSDETVQANAVPQIVVPNVVTALPGALPFRFQACMLARARCSSWATARVVALVRFRQTRHRRWHAR